MKEDIIRMAREADLWLTSDERIAAVERFAALVRADEREACAKLCYETELRFTQLVNKYFYESDAGGADAARQCAEAIRARGQA
jgi:hypothetical protein